MVTFGSIGPRRVSVTSYDSEGLSSSQVLTLDVLPPLEEPHPTLTSYGVYATEPADPRIEVCPREACCAVHRVASQRTIDLTVAACQIGAGPEPAPRRYFGSVVVDNPRNEALRYEWQLLVTDERTQSKRTLVTGEQPSFPLVAGGNSVFDTDACEVTLKLTAADPTHSLDRFTVWSGRCSFFHSFLN